MCKAKTSPLIDDHSASTLNECEKNEREESYAPISQGLVPRQARDAGAVACPCPQPLPVPATSFLPSGLLRKWDSLTKKCMRRKQRRGKVLLWSGVLLVILIVLSLVVRAVYTSFAFQDITAFQVSTQKAVPLYIGGGGIIYPRQQIPVSYVAAGRITNVIVKVGDQVTAGQPLITLDQSQVNTQISQAGNDVAAAQAYLNSVSGAVPSNPVTVANAQQRLQIAQNRYNALQSSNTLQNGNLVAPAAGIISAINVTPGQNFAAQAVL